MRQSLTATIEVLLGTKNTCIFEKEHYIHKQWMNVKHVMKQLKSRNSTKLRINILIIHMFSSFYNSFWCFPLYVTDIMTFNLARYWDLTSCFSFLWGRSCILLCISIWPHQNSIHLYALLMHCYYAIRAVIKEQWNHSR